MAGDTRHTTNVEISLKEMQELVTAVITFNSVKITTAILSVDQLKQSLMQQLYKTQSCDKASSIHPPVSSPPDTQPAAQQLETTVTIHSLQSAFLRPDTPPSIDHANKSVNNLSQPEQNTRHLEMSHLTERSGDTFSASDVLTATQTKKDLVINTQDIEPEGLVNPGNAAAAIPEKCKTSANKKQQDKSAESQSKQKKCAKLDELLKNHVSFTPYNQLQDNWRKRRGDICTKQVDDVVHNTQASSRRLIDSSKLRKRKSAAPQYIPVPTPHSQATKLSNSNSRDVRGQSPETELFPSHETHHTIDKMSHEPTMGPATSNGTKSIHDELFNQSVASEEDASYGLCGSDITLGGPFITNSAVNTNSANLNNSLESTSDPYSTISIQPDQLTHSSHIDLSNVLDHTMNSGSVTGELPYLDFASMTGLDGLATDGAGVASTSVGTVRGRGRGKKTTGRKYKSRKLNAAPPTVPPAVAESPSTSDLFADAGLLGDVAADESLLDGEVARVKTDTSRGLVIPLRLRCRRCGERFTAKSDYQIHLKSQICSTGYTQTHTCQICGYCALTRQRLIVHLRTHSGERPHRCPFCSYAATQQAPLKRHIQNIHMKQGAVSLST